MSEQKFEELMDSLILGDCVFMLSKHYDGGVNLRKHESKDLVHALERSMRIDRNDLGDVIREELGYRTKGTVLEDESQGRHAGICRSCDEHKPDLSNDDGYCGDCN